MKNLHDLKQDTNHGMADPGFPIGGHIIGRGRQILSRGAFWGCNMSGGAMTILGVAKGRWRGERPTYILLDPPSHPLNYLNRVRFSLLMVAMTVSGKDKQPGIGMENTD